MKSIQRKFIIRSLILFIAGISISGCNNESSSDTATTEKTESAKPAAGYPVFDMLAGLWQSADGKSFERWTKNDNGTYKAVAFSIKGADTSWNEQADIYEENEKWVYENKVKGQNNGKSVRFTSTSLTANSVQFSNPAHDFPTDINYTLPDKNTVHAFIVGPNEKGGKDTIPFNYTRIE